MGSLIYAAGTSYPMDDRTLAHVKVATGLRLRRHESFYLSWRVSPDQGSGRISVWVSPGIALQFHFSSPTNLNLNRAWLQALNESAEHDGGMLLMSEEEAVHLSTPAQASAMGRVLKA